jgi:hypothetical protein
MSDDPDTAHVLRAEQIDAICDRFERDWSEGRRPRLEDVLTESSAGSSLELFRALLGVELELRLRAREKISAKDYEQRFPDWKPLIREVFLDLKRGERNSSRTDADRRSTISLAAPAEATAIDRPES